MLGGSRQGGLRAVVLLALNLTLQPLPLGSLSSGPPGVQKATANVCFPTALTAWGFEEWGAARCWCLLQAASSPRPAPAAGGTRAARGR